MAVNPSVLISALSLIVAVIVAVSNIFNRSSQDTRQSASQITTLIVKLENIADGIGEIKSDMRNIKGDVQELRDRLIIVEQSVKRCHERVDTLTGKEKE